MSDSAEATSQLPRMVGLNHIALEVRDIEAALAFYLQIFEIRLRGKSEDAAFIDRGDQFIALMKGPVRAPLGHLHFAWWWMIARSCGPWPKRQGRHCLMGLSLTFLIHGAIASKSFKTTASNSRRRAVLRRMGIDLFKTETAVPSGEKGPGDDV